jgi:hypothetical protein
MTSEKQDTATATNTADIDFRGISGVASVAGGRNPHAYEYPALCIPRGLGKITHDELTTIISKSGLGEISKIIIKPKEFTLPKWERTSAGQRTTTTATDDPQTVCYNNIYIYFKKWNTDNPDVKKYRDNIINGQSIKIVHNAIPTPIFWRCVAANFSNHHSRNEIQINNKQ